METITATAFSKNLEEVLQKTADDHVALLVKRRKGNVIVLSLEDYSARQEIVCSFSNEQEARRAVQGTQQSKQIVNGGMSFAELVKLRDTPTEGVKSWKQLH
jgi:PHD/YefM family antitoxin component YafN of YafNO toxin-antitoxin module